MQEINLAAINLATLPEAGLNIQAKLNLNDLNKRLTPEDEDSEIKFEEAPLCKIALKGIGKTNDFQLIASLSFSYLQSCGRCNDFKPQTNKKEVDILLKQRSADNKNEEDDLGVVYFTEPEINLEDILQEELILTLTPYLIPDLDSEDKCKLCNEVVKMPKESVNQSIGDLLKKL